MVNCNWSNNILRRIYKLKNNNNNYDNEIFYIQNEDTTQTNSETKAKSTIEKLTKKTFKFKRPFLLALIFICSLTIIYIISTTINDFTSDSNSIAVKETSFTAIENTEPYSLGTLSDGQVITAYELPNKLTKTNDLKDYTNIVSIYKDTVIYYTNQKRDESTNLYVGSLSTYNLKTKKAKIIFKEKKLYSNVQINDNFIIAQTNETLNVFDRKTNKAFEIEIPEITNLPNSRATLLTNNSIAIIVNDSIIYYNLSNKTIEKEIKDVIFNGFLPEAANDEYALLHVAKSFKSEIIILNLITGETFKFNFENSILIESIVEKDNKLIILTSNNNDFIFDKKTKEISSIDSTKSSGLIETPENAFFTNYVIRKGNLNEGIIRITSLKDLKTTDVDVSSFLKDALSSNLTFLEDSIILEVNKGKDSLKRYHIMIEK